MLRMPTGARKMTKKFRIFKNRGGFAAAECPLRPKNDQKTAECPLERAGFAAAECPLKIANVHSLIDIQYFRSVSTPALSHPQTPVES